MTDTEILRKIILKVKDKLDWNLIKNQTTIFFKTFDMGSLEDNWAEALNSSNQLNHLIYRHDFAKAFWGEKQLQYDPITLKCLHCGINIGIQPPYVLGCNHAHYGEDCDICADKLKDWKYHLQKMVLDKEPLQYLESFL